MSKDTSDRFEFPRSTPEAQGISSDAILALVESVEAEKLELHSLMLLRHGNVVSEGWWAPYLPLRPHMLFSLSKSFTATAAGLAIAEGKLSLDDTVLSFFPDDAPAEVSSNLAAMRLRHLLSMSTGHDQDTLGPVVRGKTESWVRGFLEQPVDHEPGTHFVYNSGASYMISAIVQEVTGETLLEYLRPRLLDPLGIVDATWESSPQGINSGGWGLSITTDAIARFGQLYLQKGVWLGKRLLSEAWVEEATSKQVSNGSDPENDWNQGYGYQFWRSRHGAYRGDGAFGQFCVILPEQDVAVAITSGTSNMGAILRLIWTHLLPGIGTASLSEDSAAQARLQEKLSSLALPIPVGEASSPMAEQVSGKTYRFDRSEVGEQLDKAVDAITFDFQGGHVALTITDARGEHRIEASSGSWISGTTTLGDRQAAVKAISARGAWSDPETYVLKLYFTETPFALTITSQFVGDRVRFEQVQNVAFGPTNFPVQEGHC